MRGLFLASILFIQFPAYYFLVQPDKLEGRWEGKVQSAQGERSTTVIFKKEGDTYTGRTPSLRQGQEILIKDIKIDGDKVTAKADVDTPQASVTITYTFTLAGETMKGEGSIDFGGQNFTFDIDLKRVSNDTAGPLESKSQTQAQAQTQNQNQNQPQAQSGSQQRSRSNIPQPQQKQSIDYFAGRWNFKYIGRESALWPAPREGVVTFTKRADGKSVEGITEGNADGNIFKETSVIAYDDSSKMLTFTEKLAGGAVLNSKGDWTSPISIRFAIEPVKIKGQTLQLRRTISVVAAHTYTVSEELSEDGGPFVRLGSAVFTRDGAK
jgi:hypothetical protein